MSATLLEQNSRFDLASAAHRFLFDVLPLRRSDSERALAAFIAAIVQSKASPFEIDTVLLRCLAVLDRNTRRVPSLVDQYVQEPAAAPADVSRFAGCVGRVLRFGRTSDGAVQDAIQLIGERFAMPECSPRFVAAAIGKRLSALDVSFKAQTGCTLTEHIRDLRLERAAMLLAASSKSIKEIWVEVGFMHHSNFDHDFKRKFGLAPRAYRAQAIRPVAREFFADGGSKPEEETPPVSMRILIVDADQRATTVLRRYLGDRGHSALVVTTSDDALAALNGINPHGIFLEYRQTDADAVDVLRRLRAHPNGATARAVVFTADWDAFERITEFSTLEAVVISKLCDPQVVADLVASL